MMSRSKERLVDDIEEELSRLFRRSRTMMMGMARRVHPEMDASGYALVVQVGVATESGRGGVRASQVAEALGLDKSTVSRSVAQLERLGVIERIDDPQDGRARLLRLTKDGARRYTAIRTQRRVEFEATLRRWDTEDLEALARLLYQLNTDFS